MTSELQFTGERFVPGIAGEIAHEHWHRYAFARRYVGGKRVLDVACGEGYGSALLAQDAHAVIGVDIAETAVAHARATYAAAPNLRFETGGAAALPLADASVDVVVSFETIEHLPRADQPRMVAEIARVLAPGGRVVLSAPNPVEYSDARNYRNPYHTHEPPREELAALLGAHFPAQRWFAQRRYFGSAIWSEHTTTDAVEAWQAKDGALSPAVPPDAMYFLVVAAASDASLPATAPLLSLLSDRDDVELARIDAQAADVLRLDALLQSRDASMDRATAHIRHLESLVAVRERLVEERDAQLREVHATFAAAHERFAADRRDLQASAATALAERDTARSDAASRAQAVAALDEERARLERALAAQERIIAHRQSVRWWLGLPALRLRMWWQGRTGR